MKYVFVFLALCGGIWNAQAQDLSGKVIDAETKVEIPFAELYILDIQLGTIANENGAFHFQGELPKEMTLRVGATTYETKLLQVKKGDVLTIALQKGHLDLEEIVIVASPGVMDKENIVQVDRMELKELTTIPSATLIEAIGSMNGVQQASSTSGNGKPVVRGMQGMRVVTSLNGMRLENQQWGGDHGFGISQLGVDAVELIKGPASLLYGSDALGGVIYLTEESFAAQNTYNLQLNSKFQSVDLGVTNSVYFNASKKNVRFALGGLTTSNGDYQLANGKYLENSRYQDHGFKARFGINKGNWYLKANYLFGFSRFGIPGDEHSENDLPENHWVDQSERSAIAPSQAVQNQVASVENVFKSSRNTLSVILGHSYNKLTEYEETFDTAAIQMHLNSTMINAKDVYRLGNWSLISGYQGMYQINSNDALAAETIVPNSTQWDNGVYLMVQSSGFLAFQGGIRYDQRNLITSDFYGTYSGLNASAGARVKWWARGSHVIRLNASTGFRPPHPSELFADGEHHGAARYEIGDSQMRAERALQLDLNYEVKTEHLTFEVNPYYTFLQDYIQLQATDSVIDNLPVFQYVQVNQAQLYGFDASVHYHPHFAHWLHWETGYSLVLGESLSGAPLSFMPQPRLQTVAKVLFGLKHKFQVKEIAVQHQYYFKQDRIGVLETTSSAYHLLNLGATLRCGVESPLDVSFGVKNLLGTNYVNHLSRLKYQGFTEPGRNFYISLKWTISKKMKSYSDPYDIEIIREEK